MRLLHFAISLALGVVLTNSTFGQPRSGSLTITTEPGATVWINDVRFGKADSSGRLTIRGLDGTRHTVRVRADGFKEAQKAIASPTGEVKIPLFKTTDAAELSFQEAERMLSVDREKAISSYRKAIRLRPNYTAAQIGLARVLSDSGEYDAALKAIREARRSAPTNAEASAVEGRIFKESGDETKSITAFRRSITQGRGFQPEAYTGLALLYKERAEAAGAAGKFDDETSNYTEAEKDLAVALKQLAGAPDSVILYQLLGLIYERQKKYEEAIRVYNEFLDRFPDSNDAPTVKSFIEQIKKQRP
jgi:tetratricopeptide (TPR) repeat protein